MTRHPRNPRATLHRERPQKPNRTSRKRSWGAEDLSAALGAPRNRRPDGTYLDVYRHCRVQTLLAAAASAVAPLDGVYVDFRDREGLEAECREAAWMGYTGKMTIH
ncbi:MAG: aldolase/citrate lyase family protein, partial [Rhodopirellula sp. JB055]|uniref:aldolase/citrate lyase family protein n=1 Tax=Rhodopirellula sp. JB055 TaxID=3342846 RepID=UPI00370ACBD8